MQLVRHDGSENRNLTGPKGLITAEKRPAAGLPVDARSSRLLSSESNLLNLSACAVAVCCSVKKPAVPCSIPAEGEKRTRAKRGLDVPRPDSLALPRRTRP